VRYRPRVVVPIVTTQRAAEGGRGTVVLFAADVLVSQERVRICKVRVHADRLKGRQKSEQRIHNRRETHSFKHPHGSFVVRVQRHTVASHTPEPPPSVRRCPITATRNFHAPGLRRVRLGFTQCLGQNSQLWCALQVPQHRAEVGHAGRAVGVALQRRFVRRLRLHVDKQRNEHNTKCMLRTFL
jgi:hypothetical protein